MTAPLTHKTPTVSGPDGRSFPSSSTNFASSVGTSGPQEAGFAISQRAEFAVMIPQVSVMP